MSDIRTLTDEEKQLLIATARGELGKHEEKGQNIGSCHTYQVETGNGNGDSWCESFEVWAFDKTFGKSRRPFPASGACQVVREWCEKHDLIRTVPTAGMWGFVVNGDDHAHHTFLLTSDPAGPGDDEAPASFATVEGNTNNNGSSNGDGVYDRRRGAADDSTFNSNTYAFAEIPITD